MNLRQLGEDRLLEKLAPLLPGGRAVVSGVGDDCALTRFPGSDRLLVLKTDCVISGVHFLPKAKPQAVGWKALARPLSDFAATSAVPQFALVTLMAPPSTPVKWVTDLYRGLAKIAGNFRVAIVGGETSGTTGPLAITVHLAGYVEAKRWTGRAGGRPGDELFVTGKLGGSIRGKHLRFTPRLAESRWLTSHFPVHAMMDLSDGLGTDLPRLAKASGLGYVVDQAAIPRTSGCSVEQAISDGEDYELLFALPQKQTARLQKAWAKKFPKLPLTRIGQLTQKSNTDHRKFPAGYAHFQ